MVFYFSYLSFSEDNSMKKSKKRNKFKYDKKNLSHLHNITKFYQFQAQKNHPI